MSCDKPAHRKKRGQASERIKSKSGMIDGGNNDAVEQFRSFAVPTFVYVLELQYIISPNNFRKWRAGHRSRMVVPDKLEVVLGNLKKPSLWLSLLFFILSKWDRTPSTQDKEAIPTKKIKSYGMFHQREHDNVCFFRGSFFPVRFFHVVLTAIFFFLVRHCHSCSLLWWFLAIDVCRLPRIALELFVLFIALKAINCLVR